MHFPFFFLCHLGRGKGDENRVFMNWFYAGKRVTTAQPDRQTDKDQLDCEVTNGQGLSSSKGVGSPHPAQTDDRF